MDRLSVWVQFLRGKLPTWPYILAAMAFAFVFGGLGALPGLIT